MKKPNAESLEAIVRARIMEDPNTAKLLESKAFKDVLSSISTRPRIDWADHLNIELWLAQSVKAALAEPEITERMTGAQRRAAAKRISKAVSNLWEALQPFARADGYFAYPFQPYLDYTALEIASADAERWEDGHSEDEVWEITHRTRYAIYLAMNAHLRDVLGAFGAGAQHLEEIDTVLKKPNDPNAKRLYFLRVMTRSFTQVFGRDRPHREATLRLAEIYFDCSDLDEAAVSTLAPVKRPTPVEIPREELLKMRELMVSHGVDTSVVQGLIDRADTKDSGAKD